MNHKLNACVLRLQQPITMMLTKLIIALLLIMNAVNLSAQSRWSAGASYGYFSNNRLITSHSSKTYKEYRNENEASLGGFNGEVLVAYRLTQNLGIESGFGFSNTGYAMKEEKLIDPGFSPTTSGFKSELTRYTNKNLYLPLHLTYSNLNRLGYVISAGPSLIFRNATEVEYILRKQFGDPEGQKKTIRENTSDLGNVAVAFDLGIGLRYRITKRVTTILQPSLRYELTGSENTDIRDGRYYIGLFENENKTTREHLISYGASVRLMYNL